MNARFARNAFATARRSVQASSPASIAGRVARRPMSASASHGAAKSSDTPWIVGSLLIFGPMFLYLVSPSARKSQASHAVHNDKHDFPTLHKEETPAAPATPAPTPVAASEPAVEIMKDDEGTEANVAESIQLSEASDVPNGSQSPEDFTAIQDAATTDKEEPSAPAVAGEGGAIDQGAPRSAAVEGLDPKSTVEDGQKEN